MFSISKVTMILVVIFSLNLFAQNKILILSTSHVDVPKSERKTGLWLTELTHPYVAFRKAGYLVDIATVNGKVAPIDPKSGSESDLEKEFKKFPEGVAAFINPKAMKDIKPEDYIAIFLAGGHGTMWDFATEEVGSLVGTFYQKSKPVGAVCHGPAGLLKAKNSSGESILKGKTVTAFTNTEEKLAGWTSFVPFLLEDEMVKLGAEFKPSKIPFSRGVQTSGLLVTGQNPRSATATAEALVSLLKK